MGPKILKYPRTPHLSGSELQRGDSATTVPFSSLRDRPIVVEEKLDGANCAVSFAADGRLLLQSRGHYLTGGARERHFAWLKTWAECLRQDLHDALGARYVMYGEWMYAKHTVYYDRLPHYFHEFDLYDRDTGLFLCTTARAAVLEGLDVVSVPVLYAGAARSQKHLLSLVGPSLYKSDGWRQSMAEDVDKRGQYLDMVQRQTEDSDLAEGLYVKWEDHGQVLGRYKYVRPGFVQSILDAEGHWLNRPILPNRLAAGVSLYGGV